MSADLQAVAGKLGNFWRVSKSGKSLHRNFGRVIGLIGPRDGHWWAGVIASSNPVIPIKPPAPIWSEFIYASPEQAALAAERAAGRWEGAKRFGLEVQAWFAANEAALATEVFSPVVDCGNPFDKDDEVFQ